VTLNALLASLRAGQHVTRRDAGAVPFHFRVSLGTVSRLLRWTCGLRGELELKMRNNLSKAMVAGVAALSLTASVFATTEPASAAFRHGGGGFHGGGFHGGGFHGGGGWRGGGWRGGGGWGGAAVLGGLAAGALLAAPYYGYGYGDPYCGNGYGPYCYGPYGP
jgi:hypothetical protein